MTERIEDNQERFIKNAVQQFVNAQMEGQEPDIDEFVKKYPDYGHKIKQMILNICKIDTLFDSLVQADESDFEDIAYEQEDLVGQKVGNLEIVEMIGRGGMGVVYLAADTKLKRSVAVKSIPSQLAANSKARMRFRREAEILASLNHPNIAVIYDIVEQDEGAGYLILEYVPGETLSERIAREQIDLNEVLSICRQVAEAVSAAHKKGIVHRDLKPGNIKITPEGRVKVLDFGLAKLSTNEGKSNITETHSGRVIGTPAYMSPEQARGKETDHRTDIWSFGCILYQMLTGQLPFDGETATDTLAHIIERQPDWQAIPKDTPENIRILMHSCLEKDLDKRLDDITKAALEIRETLSKSAIETPTKLRKLIKIIGLLAVGFILSGLALKYIYQRDVRPSSKQTYYLRGNEYYYRGYLESDLRNAIRLYESVIELDPNFALAYTQLARAHSRIYWFEYDSSQEQIAMTKQAVDKAFELDPDLPEAHLALGQYYYHCHRDYESALEQFEIARKGRPDDGEPLSMICFVKRHQLKYEEALGNIERAYMLNPLSNSIAVEAGTTCFHLHKYEKAEYYYDRAISLAPDMYPNYFFKAKLYLSWQGSTQKARQLLKEAFQNARGVEYPFIVHLLVNIEIYDKNYQQALSLLDSWPSDSFDAHFFFIPKALLYAQIYGLSGNRQLEQSNYETAQKILIDKIAERPGDPRLHSSLGIAYAGLGLKEEAITEGLQGRLLDLARIYSMVGDYDLSIDKLEDLLDIPGELSIHWINLDPAWDPLRDHPRFKELVEAGK